MRSVITRFVLLSLILLGGVEASAQALTPSASTLEGCEDEPISFNANFPGATSYTWEFGDPANSQNLNETTIFSYSTAGTYTVRLTAVKNGQQSVATLQIKINKKPKITIKTDPVKIQCFKGNRFEIVFIADDTLCGQNVVTFSDGQIFNLPDNMLPGDSFVINKIFSINQNQDTDYDMTVEVTSCNGCTTVEEVKNIATVLAQLGVNAVNVGGIGCNGILDSFLNLSTVPFSQVQRFIWFFGDGTVDSSNWSAGSPRLRHLYNANGTFVPKLYVETARCADTFFLRNQIVNSVFSPIIVADEDSSCISDSERTFTVIDGPDPNDVAGVFWNMGDNFMDQTGSGRNFNNVDYPTASYAFGKLGPFQVYIDIFHRFCPPIRVFDTVQMIGPQATIESPPAPNLIAIGQRYQCVIEDTVQFLNLSTFYHNDSNFMDGSDVIVWSNTDTFKLWDGNEYGFVEQPGGDWLQVFNKAGNTYTPLRRDTMPLNQRYQDQERVHRFAAPAMQEALEHPMQIRTDECVMRLWEFDDPYAPECTTNTEAGVNVGKNCQFSRDSLPKHGYMNWDTAMAYWDMNPQIVGVFDETTQSCRTRNVYPDDRAAVINYISPFFGKDSIYENVVDTGYVTNELRPKPDSFTRDTIPLIFYKPGLHQLIAEIPMPGANLGVTRVVTDTVYDAADTLNRKIAVIDSFNVLADTIIVPEREVFVDLNPCGGGCDNGQDTITIPADTTFIAAGKAYIIRDTFFQGGDSISLALYRTLFYRNVVRCFNVRLEMADSCHPLECESESTVSLAMVPPSSRNLRIIPSGGNFCLAPPAEEGVIFDVSNTKPGCSQEDMFINFDSASGPNWTQLVGGLTPGNRLPPGPPQPGYDMAGAFGTSFTYQYTPNNYADIKNGWITVGLIVANGIASGDNCYDTTYYHRAIRYRFADPNFSIVRPIERAQGDKAFCRYEDYYIEMASETQPDVETFSLTWGDGNRTTENRNFYDNDARMRQFFLNQMDNIDKYLLDTANLGGRLTPYAALMDSINAGFLDSIDLTERGWQVGNVIDIKLSCQDSINLGLKTPYSKDSLRQWLANPNALVGWIEVVREINNDAIKESLFGNPAISDTVIRDTFLTSVVLDYESEVRVDPIYEQLLIEVFTELNFDYFDIPRSEIGKFLGPTGSGRCIDTTGAGQFFSFFAKETSPCGIKRLSTLDTNVVVNWKHNYETANIFEPIITLQVKGDNCSPNFSQKVKVGVDKEIILSDTTLCKGKDIFAVANYWYWTTPPLGIPRIDFTDYWRDPARLIANKEALTKWDWDLRDSVNDYDFLKTNFVGSGLGNNPPTVPRGGITRRDGVIGPKLKIRPGIQPGIRLGGGSSIYYEEAGRYQLGILAQDSNGCYDTTKQDIYVTDVTAFFAFDRDRPQCKTVMELLDSSFVLDPCDSADFGKCDSIIEWIVDWGDGSPIGGKNTRSADARLGHNFTRNGIFTVQLIVNTALGCSDTFEREVNIPGPKPFFEPLKQVICVGEEVSFINTSINPTSSAIYVLSYGDGKTDDATDFNDTFRHMYNTPGVYNVFLTQFDSIPEEGKFCSAIYPDTTGGQQALITITVIALDSTSLIADDTVVCKGQPILFSNVTPNVDNKWTSYKWVFDLDNPQGDTITRPDSFISYSYPNAGVYRVTMVPEYRASVPLPRCPSRDTMRVFVDTVKADFTVDTTNTPNMCFNNTSFNAVSYRWWFDTYKDSVEARNITNSSEQSTEENPCFTYDSLGCYFVVLEATSPDGCRDTTVQIVCNTFRFIVKTYNTFTPGTDGNGDGINDVFDIPIEGQDLYELVIYNRYGTKVFESEDANNDWNGQINNTGPEVAEGTYYYYLRYKEKRNTQDPEEMFGVIFLIREK